MAELCDDCRMEQVFSTTSQCIYPECKQLKRCLACTIVNQLLTFIHQSITATPVIGSNRLYCTLPVIFHCLLSCTIEVIYQSTHISIKTVHYDSSVYTRPCDTSDSHCQ